MSKISRRSRLAVSGAIAERIPLRGQGQRPYPRSNHREGSFAIQQRLNPLSQNDLGRDIAVSEKSSRRVRF